jgi:hypothetical protein
MPHALSATAAAAPLGIAGAYHHPLPVVPATPPPPYHPTLTEPVAAAAPAPASAYAAVSSATGYSASSSSADNNFTADSEWQRSPKRVRRSLDHESSSSEPICDYVIAVDGATCVRKALPSSSAASSSSKSSASPSASTNTSASASASSSSSAASAEPLDYACLFACSAPTAFEGHLFLAASHRPPETVAPLDTKHPTDKPSPALSSASEHEILRPHYALAIDSAAPIAHM